MAYGDGFCGFSGTDPADPDRPRHSAAAAERGEDPGVRSGQEAGGAARDSHSDAGADATQQAGGLLHQIQDAGEVWSIFGDFLEVGNRRSSITSFARNARLPCSSRTAASINDASTYFPFFRKNIFLPLPSTM